MKFKFFLVFISFIFFNFTALGTSLNSSIQEYTNYYESGKLESKGTLLDGKKIGVWNFYHENGNIAEEHSYINGDSYLGLKIFNESGTIVSSGIIINGKQEGEWRYFDEKGILLIKMNFKNGVRNGIFVAYAEDGAPIVAGIFENNEIVQIDSIK